MDESLSSTVSLGWPTRPSGTLVMPEEMYSVIVVPLGCDVPEAGSVPTTLFFSMVALSAVFVMDDTLKPSFSSASRASSWV